MKEKMVVIVAAFLVMIFLTYGITIFTTGIEGRTEDKLKELDKEGKNYMDILLYYYTGVEVLKD